MLPSVLILAPCYVASYGPARDSVGNFMAEYTEAGGKIRIKSGWRSSNIHEIRTMCVEHHAIPSNFDMVCWIDDDNCFTPEQAMSIVYEASERKTIVGALYRTRSERGKMICGLRPDETEVQSNSGIQEVAWVGMGLTAMPMPVLRLMWDKYRYDMFRDLRPASEAKNEHERSEMKGDDTAFCRNWRLLGQKVLCHTNVKIGHIGPTIFHVETVQTPETINKMLEQLRAAGKV